MSDPVQTPSGIPLEPVYGPADRAGDPPAPGTYPFTRGNFAGGYRGKMWTFRQYSGFGTAEESNQRYRYLLDQGGTGLSVALDLPTQCGYDSDDPEYGEEVGRVGVAVDTLRRRRDPVRRHPAGQDQHQLHDQRHRRDPARVLRRRRREDRACRATKLTGTIQNDILKEYASRGTWIWPPEPSLRLIADTIEFCAAEVPRFNAISVAGAHFRDAGANAVAGDGASRCRRRHLLRRRGRARPDDHRPVRAADLVLLLHARRLLRGDRQVPRRPPALGHDRARALRRHHGQGVDVPRSAVCRGGASLYAPQAQNNMVRVAYEAMAAVLGGVQSMFTAAWDEPFALPSEESATLALRTQQILAYETGVDHRWPTRSAARTSSRRSPTRPRRRSSRSWTTSRSTAGWCEAIEDGYLQGLIADEAFKIHQEVESGERPVVGVNRFVADEPPPEIEGYETRRRRARDLQLERLAKVKARARRRGRRATPRGPGQRRGRRRQPDAQADRLRQRLLHGRRDGRPRSRRCGASSSSRWCSECLLASSSPSPASTATTAAPRSSRARCATRASR